MRLLPRNLFLASLFHIPLHPAMLQKIAMTRRFICHHGMLQPLRWLDVTSTVAVGQRCRLSTEKCNKFTVPQLTHGRSSHLEGHLTQQPWMKTWYFCQVRRFGEDVCAPRVAAQPGNGSVFVDSSVWQVRHTDEDLSDETRDVVRNELGDSTSNDQNGKSWDNQPVRGRLGRVVKWRNLLTSEEGTWPSIAAAARELGVSPRTVARRCRECNESSQIGDYKVELALRAGKPEQEQKRVEKIQKTVKHAWMVSNYGRIRNTRGRYIMAVWWRLGTAEQPCLEDFSLCTVWLRWHSLDHLLTLWRGKCITKMEIQAITNSRTWNIPHVPKI